MLLILRMNHVVKYISIILHRRITKWNGILSRRYFFQPQSRLCKIERNLNIFGIMTNCRFILNEYICSFVKMIKV